MIAQYLKGKDNPQFINRVGETFVNKQSEKFTIVECNGFSKCHIKFEDGTILYNRVYSKLKNGIAKNPNYPAIYGIGIIGQGKHKCGSEGKVLKKYTCWNSILFRSYSEKHHVKNPAYRDVTVDERWYNFQNFGDWFDEIFKPHMQNWHLDKDILVKNNKIYSPETCCFVPNEINSLFTKSDSKRGIYPIGVVKEGSKFRAQSCSNNKRYLGYYDTPEEAFQVYKVAKETYIKEVADKWKDQISEKVYKAMYNYEVEITD